jgi:hypothetical protein
MKENIKLFLEIEKDELLKDLEKEKSGRVISEI